jgi:hypothetical protein
MHRRQKIGLAIAGSGVLCIAVVLTLVVAALHYTPSQGVPEPKQEPKAAAPQPSPPVPQQPREVPETITTPTAALPAPRPALPAPPELYELTKWNLAASASTTLNMMGADKYTDYVARMQSVRTVQKNGVVMTALDYQVEVQPGRKFCLCADGSKSGAYLSEAASSNLPFVEDWIEEPALTQLSQDKCVSANRGQLNLKYTQLYNGQLHYHDLKFVYPMWGFGAKNPIEIQ